MTEDYGSSLGAYSMFLTCLIWGGVLTRDTSDSRKMDLEFSIWPKATLWQVKDLLLVPGVPCHQNCGA